MSREQCLLVLAREQFPRLTDAERELVRAACTGDIADYSELADAENDVSEAATWGASRTVQAQVIRWLCVHPGARSYIDPKGIRLNGARVDNHLNLEAVDIPFPPELLFLINSSSTLAVSNT
jgi:hypothetical protein